MTARVIRYRTTTPVPARADLAPAVRDALLERFETVRRQLDIPEDFPPQVLAEAEQAAAAPGRPSRDETAVPFVTIDPPGSMDLDQALHLEPSGAGHRVRYAIADVPAFVRPGGAVDTEAWRRVETIYAPDRRCPLHPPQLGEGAASLLPRQVRPAFVWDAQLDAEGEVRTTEVYRAMVRSVARLDYDGVQQAVDDGTAEPVLQMLKTIGQQRIALEQARGGASLPLPEQVVVPPDGAAGHLDYRLEFRPPVPAEDWNAQLSLLAGMAAARIMLDGGVGILRTMPPPDQGAVARFRRQGKALGVPWQQGETYGGFLRRLDLSDPRQLALVHEATSLFRGAGYTPFDGDLPQQREHAAVAAPYAHVTAPLRRLVDRFGLVVCEALCSGSPAPDWARSALPRLPEAMRTGDQRAAAVERACTDAVEAAVLAGYIGRVLSADIVDRDPRKGRVEVQLSDPAIVARASGRQDSQLPNLGDTVEVRVDAVDVAAGSVTMALV